jgi:hypothetical protein
VRWTQHTSNPQQRTQLDRKRVNHNLEMETSGTHQSAAQCVIRPQRQQHNVSYGRSVSNTAGVASLPLSCNFAVHSRQPWLHPKQSHYVAQATNNFVQLAATHDKTILGIPVGASVQATKQTELQKLQSDVQVGMLRFKATWCSCQSLRSLPATKFRSDGQPMSLELMRKN